MKDNAFGRYYEKNREVLLEKMRERERVRRDERNKLFELNPDMKEEYNAKRREQYRKRVDKKYEDTKQRLEKLIDSVCGVYPEFAQYLLKHFIEEGNYKQMSEETLRAFESKKPKEDEMIINSYVLSKEDERFVRKCRPDEDEEKAEGDEGGEAEEK